MPIIWTTVHRKIRTSTYSVCKGKSITVLKPTKLLFCPSLFPPAFKKLMVSEGLSPFPNISSSSSGLLDMPILKGWDQHISPVVWLIPLQPAQPATNTKQPHTLHSGNPNTQNLDAQSNETRTPRTKLQDRFIKEQFWLQHLKVQYLPQLSQTIKPRK